MVCPGLWDQSAAEHLTPGETYLQGALRGLAEELGIYHIHLTPLGEPFAGKLDQEALGVHDYELQQAFHGIWAGPVQADPAEVAEIIFAPVTAFTDPVRHDIVTETPVEASRYRSYRVGGHLVWGATAGIMKNMHQRLFAK